MARHVNSTVHMFDEWGLPMMKNEKDWKIFKRRKMANNEKIFIIVVRASTIIFKSMKHIRKTQAKAQKNPTGGHYDYGRQGNFNNTYSTKNINQT